MRQYVTLAALALALSGCAGLLDPYERDGTWKETGINDENLRAMVTNPLDLQRGSGASDTEGNSAVGAIVRLRTNRVKELPDTQIGSVGPSGAGAGNSGGEVQ